MAHDQDPLDDGPDPSEDTPEDELEDTAEDDADSGSSDWTPKDRTEATRKITELAQENARLRREAEAQPEPEEDGEDEGSDDYLDQQNALLAGELYGDEVITAAESVWDLLGAAQTTADYVAVLESYHEARSKGATPQQASGAAKPTRDEATRPRVDPNRSERSPDSDDQLAEARKSGKLSDFTGAAAAALGFGPSKR